jgi:protocatechuate 3,4-dioxygenase beta subunit
VGTTPGFVKPAHANEQAGNITGYAFRDYNADGVRNTNEPGVSNITANAFDSQGNPAGSALTGVDGSYTLAASGIGPYRVEFVGIPPYLRPGPNGANSKTTVQFVPEGGASGVSIGLVNPSDYASGNERVVTAMFRGGDQTKADPSLISHAYAVNSTSPINLTTHARANQIGSAYGIAYKRSTKDIFVSAYTKRGVGFGPGGIGAIYRVSSTGVATVLLDLGAAAGSFAQSRDFTPEPPTFDDEAYAKVGKTGFGDLDISEDESTLWTINLANRSLYKIDIAAAESGAGATGATLVGPTPDPGCNNGVARPFGLAVRDGVIYVGGVCTGESAPTAPGNGALEAYVYTYTEAGGWSTQPVLRFSLAYPRTCADIYTAYVPITTCANAGATGATGIWRPWYDALPNRSGGYEFSSSSFDGNVIAAQPMLSDIEFDGRDMILAFRDRFADQVGWIDPGPLGKGSSPFGSFDMSAIPAGDILRAGPVGANQWMIEGNGSGPTFGPGARVGDNSGPCADAQGTQCGEFYADNFNPSALTGHDEIGSGSLAHIQGAGEVVATVYDPFAIYTGGTAQFSRTTGRQVRGYTMFYSEGPSTDGAPFSKANGLGDVELIADPAPIEIGNRIWKDSNNNGIQDAAEIGIQNVTVRLYRPGVGPDCVAGNADDDQAIGRAITDQNGNYYFRTGSGPDPLIDAQGLVDGSRCPLQPNATYAIRLDNTDDYRLDEPLEGLALTTPAARTAPGASALNDSDAVYAGTIAVITYTMGPVYGANDHTLDFGFVPGLSLGNQVWFDTNNNRTVDHAEQGVAGVTTTLYLDANGNQAIDGLEVAPIATQATTALGFYLFTGLKPGSYVVCLPQENFQAGAPLRGYVSSGVGMAATGTLTEVVPANPSGNVDNDDDGARQAAGVCTNGVASALMPLTGNEPTTEVPGNASATQPGTTPGLTDPAPNANSNLTLDFGFYQAKLGNTVWNDVNNNGRRDAIEVGVPNVPVRLYAADGLTEIPVGPDGVLGTADDATGGIVTGATGTYEFCLPQGSYVIRITPPVGFSSSTGVTGAFEPAPDPSNNEDEDDNGTAVAAGAFAGTIESLPAALTPGTQYGARNPADAAAGRTTNPTLDFGLARPIDANAFSLGNRVWLDTGPGPNTNNGVMDVGEIGLPGITVTLYEAVGSTVVQSTRTDAHGYYRFDQLGAGDYFVEISPPVGFTASTGAGNEATPNTNADVNNNCVVAAAGAVRTNAITLGPLADEPANEPDVLPGIGQGATDLRANMTLDCGFVGTMLSLGNQVFEDRNNDGFFDPSLDAGINGVTVNLYPDINGDGDVTLAEFNTPMLTTTTASFGATNGMYLFGGLPPGIYVVELACENFAPSGLLNGYTSSSGVQGAKLGPYEPSGDPDDPAFDDDTLDVGNLASGARGQVCVRALPVTLLADTEPTAIGSGNDNSGNPNDGIADEEELPQYNNDPTTPDRNANLIVDFGVFKPYSLGNRVWLDGDNSGTINGTEPGLPSVNVRLYSISNTLIATATTDGRGYYRFDFLSAGNYTVEAEDPVNFNPLPAAPYGYMRSSTVNGTGIVDSNDDGSVPATVNGRPATRSAQITLGNAVNGDSEPAGEADLEADQTTAALDARYNATVDFGYYEPVQLGSRVFDDANNDGKRVSGERNGVVSLTLNLYRFDPTGGVAGICGYQNPISTTRPSTSSATFSDWYFTDLAPGSYVVEVILDPQLDGYVSSSGLNGSPDKGPFEDRNGNVVEPNAGPGGGLNNDDNGWTCANGRTFSLPINLSSRDENPLDSVTNPNVNNTLDFAFFKPLSLGNLVWNDLNNNGLFEPGEPTIAGVQVNLGWDTNNDGAVDASEMASPILTTTTDSNGLYLFMGLGAGNYMVELDQRNFQTGKVLFGYRSSTGAVIGQTGQFEPAADPDVNTVDNADSGIFDATDRVIRSLPVTLRADSEPSAENPNNDSATEDDSSNLTVDFGVFQPFSIGNRVWLDRDSDAKVSEGELGVANIFVSLFARDSDAILAQMATDANGYYRFDGLRTGDYRVQIDAGNFITVNPKFPPLLLKHVSSHPDDATGNIDVDSTDNGVGMLPDVALGIRSDWVTLGPGSAEPAAEKDLPNLVDPQGAEDTFANMTIDFGVHMTATLGSRVWVDTNKNGLFDEGETVVPNIVVTLYSISGTLVASTTTDATGTFTFTNIAPYTYLLGLQLPSGFTFTVVGDSTEGGPIANTIDPATGRSRPITLGVGETNLVMGIGIVVNPTAVVLTRFTAMPVQGGTGVRVAWQTAIERNTFGFAVLRAEVNDVRSAVRVTPQLIVATGTNGGADYSFVDVTADATKVYYYWLRETEVSGAELIYGPVEVQRPSQAPEPQHQMFIATNLGGIATVANGAAALPDVPDTTKAVIDAASVQQSVLPAAPPAQFAQPEGPVAQPQESQAVAPSPQPEVATGSALVASDETSVSTTAAAENATAPAMTSDLDAQAGQTTEASLATQSVASEPALKLVRGATMPRLTQDRAVPPTQPQPQPVQAEHEPAVNWIGLGVLSLVGLLMLIACCVGRFRMPQRKERV